MSYLNEDKYIQAILNNEMKIISEAWGKLNSNQQIELLDLSLTEKKSLMRNYIFHLDRALFKSKIDRLILSAVKRKDKESITFLLEQTPKFNYLSSQMSVIVHKNGMIDMLLLEWALDNKNDEVFSLLELYTTPNNTQYSILSYLFEYDLKQNTDQKFFLYNPEYQQKLSQLNKNNMYLEPFSFSQNIFMQYGNQKTKEEVEKLINKYIEDDSFINIFVENSDIDKRSIKKELKKVFLMLIVDCACYKNRLPIIQLFIENKIGADINLKLESVLKIALENNHLDITQYLVESGENIHPYKIEGIQYSAKNNQVEMVKYLTHFFEDKEEAWKHIVTSAMPMTDDLPYDLAYDDLKQETNQQLRKYIDHLILVEKLQSELKENQSQPQRKM